MIRALILMTFFNFLQDIIYGEVNDFNKEEKYNQKF